MHELKSITPARVDAYLEAAERPGDALELLLRELDTQFRRVQQAESKARDALRSAQRRCDEAAGRVQRLARGAVLAVRQQEDALAREALAAQLLAEQRLEAFEEDLAHSERALLEAQEVRRRLGRQMKDLRHRARDLPREENEELPETGESALRNITRLRPLDDSPSPLYLQTDLTGGTLDQRLRALEREAEIERRMQKLRHQHQGKHHARTA